MNASLCANVTFGGHPDAGIPHLHRAEPRAAGQAWVFELDIGILVRLARTTTRQLVQGRDASATSVREVNGCTTDLWWKAEPVRGCTWSLLLSASSKMDAASSVNDRLLRQQRWVGSVRASVTPLPPSASFTGAVLPDDGLNDLNLLGSPGVSSWVRACHRGSGRARHLASMPKGHNKFERYVSPRVPPPLHLMLVTRRCGDSDSLSEQERPNREAPFVGQTDAEASKATRTKIVQHQ